ncbi:MAG TPA: polyamine aminopropyltransferase [Pseudolabrys sp.]|jgi:spermidine synthase|nr:polyamine aminopropyltransferase [Pseudolabrys sp.]
MAEKRWIAETLFDDMGFRMTYEVERVLYEVQTEHQQLVLFENKFFGKMLMLDGATQISSRDEYVYQEMMSHVPLFAHGNAKEVLIIGGGDCGIAEEVLKHRTVKRLTQVEIDESVIKFAKEHYPEFTKPVFADKRFECLIEDGFKYVGETDRRFDVIIVDSTDPQGPGAILFTKEFYSRCKRCLKKGGVLITQNGVPFLQSGELATTIRHFRKLFADATCYVAAIPVYVGGHLAMGFATDNKKLRQTPARVVAQRYRKAGSFKTKYWSPELHVGAFALPRFIADLVDKPKKKR